MPLKIHWTFPVTSHWKSDNPLDNTIDKWTYVGKCHRKSTKISEALISGVRYLAP